jgi:hypothetical protein
MPVSLKAKVLMSVIAVFAAQCSPAAQAPMTKPVQVMVQAWGPFARQCATTRVSHYEAHRQLSPKEIVQTRTTCVGFSALARGDGSVELTASMNSDEPSSIPIISRILRSPTGTSRTAIQGEKGLLAYGSDRPETATALARDIGVTARQLIEPNGLLWLPIRLHLPFRVDGALSCHPEGESVDHGRRVLVLNCTLDQAAKTDHLEAKIHLTGEQQVDIATGVRLSGEITGWLDGRSRLNDQSAWQPAEGAVWYTKETEFE